MSSFADSQFRSGRENDIIYDFCISKDGKHLFVPIGNNIEIWDIQKYSLERSIITGQPAPILAIDVSHSGEYFVTCAKDSSMVIRNIGQEMKTVLINHLKYLITAVRYSPNDSILATATSNGSITLWGSSVIEPKLVIKGHTGDITDIEFINNSQIISSSADHYIIIWDIFTGKVVTKWKAGNNWIRDVSINDSRSTVISCGDDGKIRRWNIIDSGNVSEISQDRICFNWLMSCDFYDEITFAVAGHNKIVNIYFPYGRYRYNVNSYINKVLFLHGKKSLSIAVATQGSGLLIIDSKNMKAVN